MRGLTPARGRAAQQLVRARVPEELVPVAGALAVFLLGARHDGEDEDELCACSHGARARCCFLQPRIDPRIDDDDDGDGDEGQTEEERTLR